METVNHPEHYRGDTAYEVIKVLDAWELDFCRSNAIKYIARAGKKNSQTEVEDLKKAIWYLQHSIEVIESKQ